MRFNGKFGFILVCLWAGISTNVGIAEVEYILFLCGLKQRKECGCFFIVWISIIRWLDSSQQLIFQLVLSCLLYIPYPRIPNRSKLVSFSFRTVQK